MSQQGLSIAIIGNAVDMGDLEYIEGKVLSGDYFQVSGDIDAINDTIEFIVPNLKTAFLIEAKIVPNNTSENNKISAELKIDLIKKDETSIFRAQAQQIGSTNFGGSGYGLADNNGRFNVLGISLVGDGAKVIEIENTADAGGAFATMSGYTIDT
jgi:hypothetical protein